MPEKTIDAVADHGEINGDTVTGTADAAQEVFDKLAAVGIDLTDVFMVLENEGVEKFEESWSELLERNAEAAGFQPPNEPQRRSRADSGVTRCGTSATSGCPASPARAGW